MGICPSCSLDHYSGMMTKILCFCFLVWSFCILILFSKCVKLGRNVFFCRSPKFHNTFSVLFVHFALDTFNLIQVKIPHQ